MKTEHGLQELFGPETERFRLRDVFYSRTDKRGVIESGNVIFHSVSGYVWPELTGKPHKVIRHPDMPKGVFHLAWETLKAGEPFGGYVLNKAADGQNYWVFAVMMPSDEGYLSVRLKPSKGILDDVRPIYEKLRLAEMADEITPEESAVRLQKAIEEQGFENYRHFMSKVLSEELASRAKGTGAELVRAISALDLIAQSVNAIEENGSKVASLFARTEQIPYNMRLQAGRLEGSDGPISVISENHRQMSQSLTASVGDFRSAAALGSGPVKEAIFGVGATTLIADVIDQLLAETESSDEDKAKDLRALRDLEAHQTRQARSAVADVSLRVHQFSRMCKDMRRMLSGLEMTRIMCKIERSKAVGDTEGLDEIVNRLSRAEHDIGDVMTEIENAIRDITDASERLLRSELTPAAKTSSEPALLSA